MENKDSHFDFTGLDDFKKKEEVKRQEKEKFNSFLKIGKISLASIGLVVALGFAGTYGYKAYQANVDSNIAKVETQLVNTGKENILNLINKETDVNRKTFAQNQVLMNSFLNYKDMVNMLNYEGSLATMNSNNAKLFKDVDTKLKQDSAQISKIYEAVGANRDAKIVQFLNTPKDIEKFDAWKKSLDTNSFMYVGGIINLNKEIVKQLEFLDNTQKEIVSEVQNRLKAGGFDLDKAQRVFTNTISDESREQSQELTHALLELSDTEKALQENGESAARIHNILTEADVDKAKVAIKDIEDEAIAQVVSDRKKVEELIASANQNGGQLPTPTPVAATNPAAAPTTTVVHQGPSFLDYYLLYSFMNAGSSNSSYNAGYSQGLAQANQNRGGAIAALSSNPYTLKNDNSYLSKKLDSKASTSTGLKTAKSTGSNLKTVRSQLDTARAKAAQVKSVRSSELSRISSAKAAKAASAKANSSVSKSGFSGGRSFSSTGGG